LQAKNKETRKKKKKKNKSGLASKVAALMSIRVELVEVQKKKRGVQGETTITQR